MSDRVRVLVVDDSAFNRQTIRKMIESDQALEVVATAVDGMDAIAKTMRHAPDLITLDFEMPELDGFGFLRWLMKERPTPVIMVSSNADAKIVFKALELGAVDFIAKPSKRASAELITLQKDLVMKAKGIRALKLDILSRNLKLIESYQAEPMARPPAISRVDAIAIGTSTGGPPALQIILSKLPRDLPSAVVISQHMPKGFTRSFAERLDKSSGIRVKEAEDGDLVARGSVLLAPGGAHMTFKRTGADVRVILKDAVPDDKYVPSVDIMMNSALDAFGARLMGVVLTGMGNDGRDAMVELHKSGCFTIAESEETAVVYGMPAEVVAAGAADMVAPLQNVAPEIIKFVMGERRT